MASKQVINPNVINPVDYYNKNCIEDVIIKLLELRPVEEVGKKALTYVINAADRNKSMVVINREDGYFEAQMANGLNLPIGEKFSPFMVIQKVLFKNSWSEALGYVKYKIMNNKNDYVRIQGEYFENIQSTDRYGVKRVRLHAIKRQMLLDDYGKPFLSEIDKYKTFTMVPDNKNYRAVVNDCYNSYSKFDHVAMDIEDYTGKEQWLWTYNLMKHIFGEDHYHLGLIYMKVLYELPKQALPILTLISQERQTGKTTFVNWMTILFGSNSIVINPQDIGNAFNGQYAQKNVIMIEESHFDSRQSMEKIKNLATQKTIAVNIKFVQQYDIPFFGKIIITSNDENKFTKVENDEIRFWVRKVPSLKGKANHQILDDLRNEIPAFLCHLENLIKQEPSCFKYLNQDGSVNLTYSRMVLDELDIKTDALKAVKMESREALHKEILIYLDDHCMQNPTVETFYFVGRTIKEQFFSHNHSFGIAYIDRVLKSNMGIERTTKTKRYVPLEGVKNFNDTTVGRPYIYPNPYYGIDVEQDNDEPTVPF